MNSQTNRLKILRGSEVSELLGVSRVTLWRWERQGLLPAKKKLGPNTVGWLQQEIEDWLSSRPGGEDASPTAECV